MFGKSLKRELGKNTGKWVSNKIFGDGHSTPYRVKISRARTKEKEKLLNLERKSLSLEQKTKQKEHDQHIKRLEKEQEILDAKRISELEGTVSEQIAELSKTKIPNESESIVDFVDELILKLDAGSWNSIIGSDDEKEGKINNKLMNAYLSKYNQALLKMKRKDVSEESLIYYEKKYKKLKWKKNFGLYKALLGLVALGLVYLGYYLFYIS